MTCRRSCCARGRHPSTHTDARHSTRLQSERTSRLQPALGAAPLSVIHASLRSDPVACRGGILKRGSDGQIAVSTSTAMCARLGSSGFLLARSWPPTPTSSSTTRSARPTAPTPPPRASPSTCSLGAAHSMLITFAPCKWSIRVCMCGTGTLLVRSRHSSSARYSKDHTQRHLQLGLGSQLGSQHAPPARAWLGVIRVTACTSS